MNRGRIGTGSVVLFHFIYVILSPFLDLMCAVPVPEPVLAGLGRAGEAAMLLSASSSVRASTDVFAVGCAPLSSRLFARSALVWPVSETMSHYEINH